MNRRGTSEWTMKQLMTLVLAVVLLALIIYGVQSKGFAPLKENIENRYNELLIFLNMRDGGMPTCGDAFVEEIPGVGSGMFYPCEINCTFVLNSAIGGYKAFALNEEGFRVGNNDVWESGSDFLQRVDLSYERNFYEGAMTFILREFGESLDNKKELGYFNDFKLCPYFCSSSKTIVFEATKNNNIQAQLKYDGHGVRFEDYSSGEVYEGQNINVALDKFYKIAHPPWPQFDCYVRYSDLDNMFSLGKGLSELDLGEATSKNNELDGDDEIGAIGTLLEKWKSESVVVSQDKIVELKKKFDVKTIEIGGVSYSVSVDFSNQKFPYIVFDSGSEKLAIGYIARIKSVQSKEEYLPLGLYRYKENKWEFVDGQYFYKMNLEDYNDASKINKIYENFKKRGCAQ